MFFVHLLRGLSFIWPFREANTRTLGEKQFPNRKSNNCFLMDVFINERTKYPLFVSRTLDFYF